MATTVHIDDDLVLPRVFGRYLLVQRLSSGGMGEIYLAKHGLSGFEKLCVIKKILPHLSEDEHFISRFVDEAQVAIHLQHANVAQVFEVGRVGDEYFLSLEYVEGRDLRRSLQVLAERGQRFPLDLALLIVRDMANGLAYAHRRTGPGGKSMDLVHCDISPPNVLVSFEGETKIIDFGIAKSAMRMTATNPNMGFGKFGYMSPEQLMLGGKVDHRTDIYATGAVLFEILLGTRLYAVDGVPDYRALAQSVMQGEHPKPSDLDPELAFLDGLVHKALAVDPKDRYQSAAELRDAIQQVLLRVNPMVSTDALGTFMRQLFRDEMEAQRRMTAEVRATDMSAWQAQLTQQSSTTVSFALVPTGPVRHGASAGGAPFQARKREMPRRRSRTDHEVTTPTFNVRDRRERKRRLMVAVSVLVITGSVITALAWSVSSWMSSRQRAAEARGRAPAATATGPERDGPGEDKASGPTVAALTERDLQDLSGGLDAGVRRSGAGSGTSDSLASEQETDEPETDDPSGRNERVNTNHARTSSRKKKERQPARGPGTPVTNETRPDAAVQTTAEQDELSRAEVEAMFRSVNREYREFEESYGARLADRWADLVQDVQYAQSPDKLRTVARQLKELRAEMQRIRKGSE